MSTLKNINYPSSIGEKFFYYCGKTYCLGAKLIGASIYARFLWKQPYLTDRAICHQSIGDLNTLIDLTRNKKRWHWKSLFVNVFIATPFAVATCRYKYLTPKQSMAALAAIGLCSVNNMYGIFAHYYNIIRFKHQVYRLNSLNDTNNQPVQKNISTILDLPDTIIKEKNTWYMYNYNTNGNGISYIVHNAYYQSLFFIFQIEKTAKEFLDELNTLPIDKIDYLASNPEEAIRIQQEFVRTKVYEGLYYGYLAMANKKKHD